MVSRKRRPQALAIELIGRWSKGHSVAVHGVRPTRCIHPMPDWRCPPSNRSPQKRAGRGFRKETQSRPTVSSPPGLRRWRVFSGTCLCIRGFARFLWSMFGSDLKPSHSFSNPSSLPKVSPSHLSQKGGNGCRPPAPAPTPDTLSPSRLSLSARNKTALNLAPSLL